MWELSFALACLNVHGDTLWKGYITALECRPVVSDALRSERCRGVAEHVHDRLLDHLHNFRRHVVHVHHCGRHGAVVGDEPLAGEAEDARVHLARFLAARADRVVTRGTGEPGALVAIGCTALGHVPGGDTALRTQCTGDRVCDGGAAGVGTGFQGW